MTHVSVYTLRHSNFSCDTSPMTTETRIRTAAAAAGWTVKSDDTYGVVFAKGRREVFVVFSVRGTVTHASTAAKSFDTDKAAKALAVLSA